MLSSRDSQQYFQPKPSFTAKKGPYVVWEEKSNVFSNQNYFFLINRNLKCIWIGSPYKKTPAGTIQNMIVCIVI